LKHSLGSLESSEALIKDLYLGLRKTVGAWSEVTNQTPQARMGYVGQHLVSVVTGYPGGKSGARGYDLIMPGKGFGEIKTCYRVDQLGSCKKCGAGVSSLEFKCASCESTQVIRKDDSKWLLSIKTDADFAAVLEPISYYFVLFEFEDLFDASNQNIIASIWEVDPRSLGFSLCMADYKINIQSNSKSSAPFNLWPFSTKFYLMKPTLVYRSLIGVDSVKTEIFPNEAGKPIIEVLPDIGDLLRKRTLTLESIQNSILELGGKLGGSEDKRVLADSLQKLRATVEEQEFLDVVARNVYTPLLKGKSHLIPKSVLEAVPLLTTI
jgi:hypothetical protein